MLSVLGVKSGHPHASVSCSISHLQVQAALHPDPKHCALGLP